MLQIQNIVQNIWTVYQSLSFLHLEIILPFGKLCYTFEQKKIFLPP